MNKRRTSTPLNPILPAVIRPISVDGMPVGMEDIAVVELRDRFAMAALTGMMASEHDGNGMLRIEGKGLSRVDMNARYAYQWADAMIKARKE